MTITENYQLRNMFANLCDAIVSASVVRSDVFNDQHVADVALLHTESICIILKDRVIRIDFFELVSSNLDELPLNTFPGITVVHTTHWYILFSEHCLTWWTGIMQTDWFCWKKRIKFCIYISERLIAIYHQPSCLLVPVTWNAYCKTYTCEVRIVLLVLVL